MDGWNHSYPLAPLLRRLISPVVPENLLFNFRDKVALCAGVLPFWAPGRFLFSSGFVLGFDLRRRPLQADECVAAFVVSQQHVDVGGGKRTLVTQVGHIWDQNKRQKKKTNIQEVIKGGLGALWWQAAVNDDNVV